MNTARKSHKKSTTGTGRVANECIDPATVVAAHRARRKSRAPITVTTPTGKWLKAATELGDDELDRLVMLETVGSTSQAWLDHVLSQLVPKSVTAAVAVRKEVTAGLAFIQGLEARTEIEAALGAQMFALHGLMMDATKRARKAETDEERMSWLDQVSQLGSTFAAQGATLAKLKAAYLPFIAISDTGTDPRISK